MWDGMLGQVHTIAHHIQLTPGAKPAYSQPYRAGAKAREEKSVEIHRMLRAGVIEPATSEWAIPVVLVPKPDGSMRFCIDYRRLNTVTVLVPTRFHGWMSVLNPLGMLDYLVR
jgi:hypothetical protein